VLKILLREIPIIYQYGLSYKGDSLNFALVKATEPTFISLYQIRYFGFDFTNKYEPINYNTHLNPLMAELGSNNSLVEIQLIFYATNILSVAIEIMLFDELDARSNEKRVSLPDNYQKLHTQLTNYYSSNIKNYI